MADDDDDDDDVRFLGVAVAVVSLTPLYLAMDPGVAQTIASWFVGSFYQGIFEAMAEDD